MVASCAQLAFIWQPFCAMEEWLRNPFNLKKSFINYIIILSQFSQVRNEILTWRTILNSKLILPHSRHLRGDAFENRSSSSILLWRIECAFSFSLSKTCLAKTQKFPMNKVFSHRCAHLGNLQLSTTAWGSKQPRVVHFAGRCNRKVLFYMHPPRKKRKEMNS